MKTLLQYWWAIFVSLFATVIVEIWWVAATFGHLDLTQPLQIPDSTALPWPVLVAGGGLAIALLLCTHVGEWRRGWWLSSVGPLLGMVDPDLPTVGVHIILLSSLVIAPCFLVEGPRLQGTEV